MIEVLTVSTEVAECPQCSNPHIVRYTINQRGCNACGLSWMVVTKDDEADLKERSLPREKVVEDDGARSIGRFQARWS